MPDHAMVIESQMPGQDFFLLRPTCLTPAERTDLIRRKNFAKFGAKATSPTGSAPGSPSKPTAEAAAIDTFARRTATIEAIDAKPLYRTHRAPAPPRPTGPSLVLVPHGDATRLTITSHDCDE